MNTDLKAIQANLATNDNGDAWLDPDRSLLESGLLAPPIFDAGLLGLWGPWIERCARSVSAPTDYVFGGLLVTAAGAIGANRKVSPWPGWEEYPALWGLMVGSPSSSKSPAFAPFRRALDELEQAENGDFADRARDFETEQQKAYQAKLRWEAEMKKKVVSLAERTPLKPAEADEPDEPTRRRILVTDTTVEAMAPLFRANERGLVLMRDELAAWFGNFNKYGGQGDAAMYLERFSGEPLSIDRVKHGHLRASPALLSIFGGCQPERLADVILSRPDDGFTSRFLYFYPLKAGRIRPMEDGDPAFLGAGLRRLRGLPMDCDDAGALMPRVVRLDTEAADAFQEWWQENGAAADGVGGLLGGTIGKGPGIVLRIALILEFLNWAASVSAEAEPATVGKRSVLMACYLFDDYFRPMAARVFGGAERTRGEVVAGQLLRRLQAANELVVNVRRLGRERIPGFRDTDDVTSALTLLAEAGWVRFLGGRSGERPGRGRSDWEVNSLLWGRP